MIRSHQLCKTFINLLCRRRLLNDFITSAKLSRPLFRPVWRTAEEENVQFLEKNFIFQWTDCQRLTERMLPLRSTGLEFVS